MTKLEVACVIIGFIMLFLDFVDMKGNFTEKETISIMIRNIIAKLICFLMIILPLYFNYWRG